MVSGSVVPDQRHAGPAECEVRAIRNTFRRAPRLRVRGRVLEDGLQRVIRALRALAIRAPAVGLDQHAEPAARCLVEVGEPRWRLALREARGGIVVVDERGIEVDGQMAERGQPRRERGRQGRRQLLEAITARGDRRRGDADVLLELRAVGGVQIDEQHRIVLREHAQHRPGLGGVRLDVVAIEVEARRGGAEPHLRGAALVRPVVRPEPLVTIGVEHGHEHDVDRVERADRDLAVEQVAQEPEPRVLALDLAGVDAGLDVDRRGTGCAGDPQRDQRSVLERAPDLVARDAVVAAREVPAQRDGFVVATGAHELRCLAGRHEGRPRAPM